MQNTKKEGSIYKNINFDKIKFLLHASLFYDVPYLKHPTTLTCSFQIWNSNVNFAWIVLDLCVDLLVCVKFKADIIWTIYISRSDLNMVYYKRFIIQITAKIWCSNRNIHLLKKTFMLTCWYFSKIFLNFIGLLK